MISLLHTRTGLQRVGYVLSVLSMGAGWLLLLALAQNWATVHWSRPALVLQVAAIALALLAQRVRARRLIVYPVILAGSIYLWDTTLPPPNLPAGWPREFIPRLVLLGLLLDVGLGTWREWRAHRRAAQGGRQWLTLEAAASTLGLPDAELRLRMQQRGYGVWVDAQEQEYVLLDELYAALRPKKPAWWQLYLWFVLMAGLALLMMWVPAPPDWQTRVHVAWAVLTWVGIGLWLWANQGALREADRAKRLARKQASASPARASRTIPLTPVQQRYLEIMERYEEP